MNSLLYVANLVSTALWVSVFSVGGAGIVANLRSQEIRLGASPEVRQDMTLTIEQAPQVASGDDQDLEPPQTTEVVEAEAMPEPPAEPETREFEPLPDIPTTTKAVSTTLKKRPPSTERTLRKKTTSGSLASAKKRGGGGGADKITASYLLSRGDMPRPSYPEEARRRGQTGSVVVEFAVGYSGKVISARIYKASQWSLLNMAALKAVKRWSFPSGKAISGLKQSITFKLN